MPYPTKKLGDISLVQAGGTPYRGTKEFWGGKIPWLKISELNNGFVSYYSETITEEGLNNSSAKLFKKGTILYSIFATIGKMGILEIEATTNQAIAGITPNEKIVDKIYLFFSLKYFTNILLEQSIGVAQNNINSTKLKSLSIPIPPLPTQKLIVQKLDLSFEKIDKSIELTKKNLENIEGLNKSVLEEVFREGEYEKFKLKELLEICEYGSSEKSFDVLKNGIPILRMGNIQNGGIDFSGLKFADKNSKTLPKLFLKNEDLLFNRTNSWELVGKTGIYNGNDDTYTFAGYLIRLRFDNTKVIQKFGNYYFNSQFFRKTQIEPQIDQQCGQANFSGGKLKETLFLLQPLDKQKEIVSHLDQVFEKNRILKEKYEKKLKDLEEMKQSLLKDAFEGRLVKD